MAKIAISITATFEVDQNWYDEGATAEEMLAVELGEARRHPFDYISNLEWDDIALSIDGKLIAD